MSSRVSFSINDCDDSRKKEDKVEETLVFSRILRVHVGNSKTGKGILLCLFISEDYSQSIRIPWVKTRFSKSDSFEDDASEFTCKNGQTRRSDAPEPT